MSEPTILGYAIAARYKATPEDGWDVGGTAPTIEQLRAEVADDVNDVEDVLGDFDLRIVEIRAVGEFSY